MVFVIASLSMEVRELVSVVVDHVSMGMFSRRVEENLPWSSVFRSRESIFPGSLLGMCGGVGRVL